MSLNFHLIVAKKLHTSVRRIGETLKKPLITWPSSVVLNWKKIKD